MAYIIRGQQEKFKKFVYCITGIFPGTFISRKMMFSTFSRFLISRPAHGCTDIKFTESVCFRF